MTPGLKLGLGAVAVLFLTVALVRSCGIAEPIVIPDWADSLRAAHAQYRQDSIQIAADLHRQASLSDSLRRAADSWRQRALVRPTRPAPNTGTIVPDSGSPDTNPDNVSGNPGSPVTHTSADSIVWLTAQIDSLWAALDASDSAYASLEAAFTAQKQATAAALAGWDRAIKDGDRAIEVGHRAISDLTARLRKARRGCRVLGLLPCPELALTGGVTTLGGAVGMGATLGVSIPIKLGGS